MTVEQAIDELNKMKSEYAEDSVEYKALEMAIRFLNGHLEECSYHTH